MGGVGRRGMRAVVAAALAVALVVGCSASGSDDAVEDTTATEPTSPPSTLPPASSAPPAAELDASKPPPKDAGKDSTVDAGPPPPVPGTSCPVRDEVKKKKCGVCGEQATACLGTGDAGGGTWAEYGACELELTGGCLPGSTVTEPCGNCGTRTKTCTQYCAYATAACTGEPVDSCVPGSVDLSTASCPTADVYRQRSCGSACTYTNFTATCSPAPASITVGPTVGSVTWTIVNLTSTQTATRLGGTCPSATLSSATTVTPYAYVNVHNPLASSVLVSVYDSLAPGGAVLSTILASYGAATPSTDVQRKACVKGVNHFGNAALTGDSDFASLHGGNAITIPAGGTITIYNAAYTKFAASNPAASTGKVRLNVRVEQIN